ncbi:hypothetical protein D9M69_424030 [compost metagenome]
MTRVGGVIVRIRKRIAFQLSFALEEFDHFRAIGQKRIDTRFIEVFARFVPNIGLGGLERIRAQRGRMLVAGNPHHTT